MGEEDLKTIDPRIKQGLDELQRLITARYPQATFDVSKGEAPEGIYLRATVDIEDTDEVVDTIIDHLLEIQVEQRLPVYVIPVRPLKRVMDELASSRRPATPRIDWGAVTPSS